ncbi:lanthionine synthetase C family protein [Streptomyces sp. NBC_01320]|uniref:lanthionine synthetase C family protein n=1 Tax=Streptomyces sp. NBC_01320 TaxID=2903824 RepID=UPI002E0D9088|nr:lanthionine synthetase C family protein [Streptomyces sp. NBC_01320]
MPEATKVWAPGLATDQLAPAVVVGLEVADRLRSRKRVAAAVNASVQQTDFPPSASWEPHSLAQGDTGLALMCGYLDSCFPDDGWDVTGHGYLEAAAGGIERMAWPSAGLFEGMSGLAFAARSLSREGTRYRKLLTTIEGALLPRAVALAQDPALQQFGLAYGQFDLIAGITGIGTYLLSRKEQDGPTGALLAVLRGLVSMTGQEEGIPRWHTPARLMGDESLASRYPYGNLNCGLAHGIPGPLALMALAIEGGVHVPGLRDAVERLACWLVAQRLDSAGDADWPTMVPLTADGEYGRPDTSRTAWCYGNPGVARSLWLAGRALNEPTWRESAIDAMAAVYRRPTEERGIGSPTFCHGAAGLLQITLRFAHDTGLPLFARSAAGLIEQLLALYEPDSLLGYRDVEPSGGRVDRPGLLTGSPGVALALLAAGTGVEPTWDRVFLLS